MSFLLSLFFTVLVSSFQYSGLFVTSPARGLLHVQLPLQELLPSWAPAVLGLLMGTIPRLFQPG